VTRAYLKVLFLLIFLLTACAGLTLRLTPYTTTVSKTQDFDTVLAAVITYAIVPDSAIKLLCGQGKALGCADGVGTNSVRIYVQETGHKHILEHELNHVVYGPRHVNES